MPPPMIEVYRLILEKKFTPSLRKHGYEILLVLTSPGGDYSTHYLMLDGKLKWTSGVSPFRILEG